MATITASSIAGSGVKAVTTTTLDGSSDTFTYTAGAILIFINDSGESLSPVIDGDGASTVGLSGVGDIDISSGFAVGSIADGLTKAIPLDSIRSYLAGTIAITSGSGLKAQLLTP